MSARNSVYIVPMDFATASITRHVAGDGAPFPLAGIVQEQGGLRIPPAKLHARTLTEHRADPKYYHSEAAKSQQILSPDRRVADSLEHLAKNYVYADRHTKLSNSRIFPKYTNGRLAFSARIVQL